MRCTEIFFFRGTFCLCFSKCMQYESNQPEWIWRDKCRLRFSPGVDKMYLFLRFGLRKRSSLLWESRTIARNSARGFSNMNAAWRTLSRMYERLDCHRTYFSGLSRHWKKITTLRTIWNLELWLYHSDQFKRRYDFRALLMPTSRSSFFQIEKKPDKIVITSGVVKLS